jgi:glutamine amidotransferase
MSQTVAVIDYGMGNLHSVAKALEQVAPDDRVVVSAEPEVINNADRLVFPGVGAIRDCMAEIKRLDIDKLLRTAVCEKPVLAVCVGMQALMDFSEENNGVDGIGLFSGKVRFFGNDLEDADGNTLKVPHMGWNRVHQKVDHSMWSGVDQDSYYYFVHSYYVEAGDVSQVVAECDYGLTFTAALSRKNLFAVQFHPEKSHVDGLQIYRNFMSWQGEN